MVRDPQKELDALLERKRGLEDSLTKREQELKELRREKKTLLERQIARATSRLNARERKLRTRKLILIGSYMEHTTKDDQAKKDRLMKGLDAFLTKPLDRALFELPPRP